MITEPVSTKDDINAIQALRQTIINKYQRRIWFILTIAANDNSKTRAEYVAELTALQKGIAAPQVMLVPEILDLNRAFLPVACVTAPSPLLTVRHVWQPGPCPH